MKNLDNTPKCTPVNIKHKTSTPQFKKKIQQIDRECSVIMEENSDLVDVENGTKDVEDKNDYWDFALNLKHSDINNLKMRNTLNSNHTEAVNFLLRNQFPGIIGFQPTEQVPVLVDCENRWKCKIPIEPCKSPAGQIHHNHKDLWDCSVYHYNAVYLLDSLGNERDKEIN